MAAARFVRNPKQNVDRGWAWVVMVASHWALFLCSGLCYSFGVYTVALVEGLNETRARVALLGSFPPSLMCLCAPLASILCQKVGVRMATIIGSLFMAVGYSLSYFATNIYFLYISYGILVGLGVDFVYLSILAATGQYFHKRRSMAMAIVIGGAGAGQLAFPPLLQFFIDQYTWRGSMLIAGAITLNICVCGAMLHPLCDVSSESVIQYKTENEQSHANEKMLQNHQDDYEADSGITLTEASDTESVVKADCCADLPETAYKQKSLTILAKLLHIIEKIDGIKLFRNSLFNSLAVNSFFLYGLASAVLILFVDTITQHGIAAEEATFILSIMGICNTVGRFVIAVIAATDRLNPLMQYYISSLLTVVASVLMPAGRTYLSFAAFGGIFGLSYGLISALLPTVATDIANYVAPHLGIHGIGVVFFVSGLGSFAMPAIGGCLFDITGSYYATYISGSVITFVTIALVCIVERCKKQSDEDEPYIEEVFASQIKTDNVKDWDTGDYFSSNGSIGRLDYESDIIINYLPYEPVVRSRSGTQYEDVIRSRSGTTVLRDPRVAHLIGHELASAKSKVSVASSYETLVFPHRKHLHNVHSRQLQSQHLNSVNRLHHSQQDSNTSRSNSRLRLHANVPHARLTRQQHCKNPAIPRYLLDDKMGGSHPEDLHRRPCQAHCKQQHLTPPGHVQRLGCSHPENLHTQLPAPAVRRRMDEHTDRHSETYHPASMQHQLVAPQCQQNSGLGSHVGRTELDETSRMRSFSAASYPRPFIQNPGHETPVYMSGSIAEIQDSRLRSFSTTECPEDVQYDCSKDSETNKIERQ